MRALSLWDLVCPRRAAFASKASIAETGTRTPTSLSGSELILGLPTRMRPHRPGISPCSKRSVSSSMSASESFTPSCVTYSTDGPLHFAKRSLCWWGLGVVDQRGPVGEPHSHHFQNAALLVFPKSNERAQGKPFAHSLSHEKRVCPCRLYIELREIGVANRNAVADDNSRDVHAPPFI